MAKDKRVSIFDLSVDLAPDDSFFPSVELLTAQVRPRKYSKTPICGLKGSSVCAASRIFFPLSCWI